ncbi:dienelactone hydrolase family protein [Nonomuraea sp. NPDC050556]|uniref:dienelactone hydrolase family protein n=1 Tax=Nonomuraea sp. NPDC050556 TaxID=3364369 RepID=UPI0037B25244
MCHTTDSRPPAPPQFTSVASHGARTLVAPDGAQVSAYRADPVVSNGRSVVLLPDVRGLHPFYQDLTQRFAEAGFSAVAIDYFARVDSDDPTDPSFDLMKHVALFDDASVTLDVAAAIAELDGPVYTVGFCIGGSASWRQAAAGHERLAGAVGFYGLPGRAADVAAEIDRPLLMLLAGADSATTQEEFQAFADSLASPYEMQVYDGAPHSFFDRAHGEWQDACDDAWKRILDFTA